VASSIEIKKIKIFWGSFRNSPQSHMVPISCDFYAIRFLKKKVTLVQICGSFGNKKIGSQSLVIIL